MRRSLPVVLLVLCLAASGCSDEPEAARDDSGAVASEGAVDPLDVEVGDCVKEPTASGTATEVESVSAVPCDQPHDGEIYATFDLPDGEFPGDEQVSTAGEQRCVEEFATYVGISYEESAYELSTLFPSQETWEQGDREYVCIAVDPAGELTGSVKGAAK